MRQNKLQDLTGQRVTIMGTEAVCILQTPTKRIYAAIEDSGKAMNWDEAQEWCRQQFGGRGHCPDRAELLWLWSYYRGSVTVHGSWYWTSEIYSSYNSWLLRWGNGTTLYRFTSAYVRAFYIEEISEDSNNL